MALSSSMDAPPSALPLAVSLSAPSVLTAELHTAGRMLNSMGVLCTIVMVATRHLFLEFSCSAGKGFMASTLAMAPCQESDSNNVQWAQTVLLCHRITSVVRHSGLSALSACRLLYSNSLYDSCLASSILLGTHPVLPRRL